MTLRCLASPGAIEPVAAENWALEVERFVVDRAVQLSRVRSRCGRCAAIEFRHFSSASLDRAVDAVAGELRACGSPAVAHE